MPIVKITLRNECVDSLAECKNDIVAQGQY